MEEKEYVEVTEDRAMLYVPHNALEATLTFKVYLDGEIKTIQTTLTQDELAEAVRKAADGYIDEDDKFVLNPDYDWDAFYRYHPDWDIF